MKLHQPLGYSWDYEYNEQSKRIRDEQKAPCPEGQIKLADEYCGSPCPEFTKYLGTGRTCKADDCSKTEKVIWDGSCKACPEFTKSGGEGTKVYRLVPEMLP